MSHFRSFTPAGRKRCMRFHKRLLSYAPSLPNVDFPEFCNAWRAATEADWVWLWMYNDVTSQWELSASDTDFDLSTLVHQPPVWPGTSSVAEYVNRFEEPVFVDDLAGWSRIRQGTTFRVGAGKRLTEMGCGAFCTVPLLAPNRNRLDPDLRDYNLPIRATICSHYRDAAQWPRLPKDSLLLMGMLLGTVIRNSYNAEHRAILTKLNEFADRHLTSVQRQHGAARRDYLHSLIKLIQQCLDVRAVSFFYQVPFENQVECLATTGMAWENIGREVGTRYLSEVRYDTNQGLTGTCFATGLPSIRVRNATDIHSPKFVEIVDGQLLRNVGTCFCPIPRAHLNQQRDGIPNAHGVIRCTDPYSPVLKTASNSFSSTAIKTLAFIARQIAPVLHTFALRVQREYAISIVKHDLETPLNMICDTADDIGTYVEAEQAVKWHDLMNLKTSAMFAQNLVDQLDPDPFLVPDLQIEKTLLEGDIVARLKHMLDHYAKKENDILIQYSMFVSPNERVPALYVDRALIERAFWNLLLNAIKYGTSGSTVNVKARLEGDTVFVDVSNLGIGVAPDDEDRIFLPNYRSAQAKRKRQGLGLGLPIARRALEKHRGQLVLLRAGTPTVFRMIFPAHLQKPTWNL